MRKSKKILGILGLLLSGCTQFPRDTVSAVTVEEFRIGLYRPQDRAFVLADEGREFRFLPNDKCDADGFYVPCMRWGYAFRYKSPKRDARLECTIHFSRPQSIVSAGSRQGDRLQDEFAIRLRGYEGIYATVQFYTAKREEAGRTARKTVCVHDGRVVLEFEFGVTFSATDVG